MSGEQLFVLLIVAMVAIVVTAIQVSKNRHRIKHWILTRLNISPEAERQNPRKSELNGTETEPLLAAEENSKAELERLQRIIEDQKQLARETDISYHLWGFYDKHFRYTSPQSLSRQAQDGEWYDVRVLQVSAQNGLNRVEFELKGGRFKFVDDEESQAWRENSKVFSLFLYDDSDRCLIEIPMKMKVDRWGRNYSIFSDGPKAFLPGDWISDLTNVILKHQSIRNQEIRAKKHQERLREIADLKDRFGVSD